MRLIDADEVMQDAEHFSAFTGNLAGLSDLAILLSGNPIDAEIVVRCKDCKHQRKVWHSDKRMKACGYWVYGCKRNGDPFDNHTVDGWEDDFCSHGERKEGAE